MKVIIFDFDDTLYNGNVWGDWNDYINRFLNSFFKCKKQKQAFLKKYLSADYLDERCICEGLIKEIGTAKPMNDYLVENPYEYVGYNVEFIDNEFLKQLSKKYKLYIVSNTPSNTIKIALSQYGVDVNNFKDILFNKKETLSSNKKDKYKSIMDLEKVSNQEILVIGDSYASDIEPAKQLCMNYLLVKNLSDIYNFNFKD